MLPFLEMSFLQNSCPPSGVSASSGLLEAPGTYQRSRGSWEFETQGTPAKTEKFADLASYISGVTTFCIKQNQTSNLVGQRQA